MKPSRKIVLSCSCMLFLAACSDSVSAGTDPATDGYALLVGRVTDISGAPVAGVTVSADIRSNGCDSSGGLRGPSVTQADGRFSIGLATLTPAAVCVVVSASPPAGSNLAKAIVALPEVITKQTH